MSRSGPARLLLGEWACLGILDAAPAHGFAVAAMLAPAAPIGRVWSLSRPLTYRALDQLVSRGMVEAVASEPGAAGPNRTVLAPTDAGRTALRTWLRTPVDHLRDLRSELLLKMLLAERCGVDISSMLATQRRHVAAQVGALAAQRDDDIVALWRHEASRAALTFLDQVTTRQR